MKVLITGGCGFIGTNLIRLLAKSGNFYIRVLDNLSTGTIDNISDYTVDLIKGDVRSFDDAYKACRNMDAVVHLAANTSVINSLNDPKFDFDVNIVGTFNMLEACRMHGVRRFIFASSNAAVGEQVPPVNEKIIPEPISPYGAMKHSGEALCTSYYHSFDIGTICLRFANVYGRLSSHKESVVAKFMKDAIESSEITIYGDGNQTRDFIHIDDICEVIYRIIKFNEDKTNYNIHGETFQVGTGKETTISELSMFVKQYAEPELKKEIGILFKPGRKGEIYRNYSDISKLREFLDFEPQVSLSEGIKDTWQWFVNYYRKNRKEL